MESTAVVSIALQAASVRHTDARSGYGKEGAGVEIVMWRSRLTRGYIPGIDRLGAT